MMQWTAPIVAAMMAAFFSVTPAQANYTEGMPKAIVQTNKQPIPLSISRVEKNMGKKGVYLYDCNPDEIYDQSHLPGSIRTNQANWWELLPEDKENSFLIFYCINRMCTVSYEAGLFAIGQGYKNVYVMPDGIQGWVANGNEFEGTGRQDRGLNARKN